MSTGKIKNINLFKEIREVILEAGKYVRNRVNFAQVISNWEIGRLIVEDEQKGEHTAMYGKLLIKELSEKLMEEFGEGYNQTNLRHYRKFYLQFPIQYAVRAETEIPNQCAYTRINTKLLMITPQLGLFWQPKKTRP